MKTTDQQASSFGKVQIMQSTLFSPQAKDVLDVILEENKSYTLENAKQLMEFFLNKEAN
ncbi:hypothetical protein [Paenibacillus wynnii]|uniref:hypothetical protein n=1 Tax=Paenibacillus wynnii TaxID=268407 RepID=UPI000AB8146D|nr:hypothetical protein [Paenibacillus wynnii]